MMSRCSLLQAGVASALGLLSATGCVQQNRYDELITANRSLQEQVVMLQDEAETSTANLSTTRSQLSDMRGAYDDLNQKYASMSGDFDSLSTDTDRFLSRISSLEIGPLPIDLENALNALASEHPNLLTFAPQQGMLRFASDFTFASGSADIKSQAASSLRSLASVLSSNDAAAFEVRVIGHTDSVPVSRPATRRNHPTNMHLSVHRAISVRNALVSAGVDAARVQVAGYGPHRPLVDNPSGGAAANRRVEIFLVPMTPSMQQAMPSAENIEAVLIDPVIDDDSPEPMK